MSKNKLIAAAAILAAGAFSGGAYAAVQSGTNSRQAFLDDVAKRLNVSPSQLHSALQGAMLDRLDAAVKDGRLTQAQADQIKQRIEQGKGGPFFGPRLGPGHFGHRSTIAAAASYIGISETQLLSELRSGKTLAQVAQAHGKTEAGLEQAIAAAIKTRLDRAVAAGRISKAQENDLLSKLSTRLTRRLNAPLHLRWGPAGRPEPVPGGAALVPAPAGPPPAGGPPPPAIGPAPDGPPPAA